MGINVILTGVTGMVGEGVLLECLRNGVHDALVQQKKKAARIAGGLKQSR